MDEWESIKASNPDWIPGFDYEAPHVDYGDTVPFSRKRTDDATGDMLGGGFGPVHNMFRHDARGAVARLLADKSGEATAALHHADVGDIDLVYGRAPSPGDEGFGLAKIAAKHPEVLGDLQGFLDRMRKNDAKSGPNRVRLESETGHAIVRLDWDGKARKWLLSAFEKRAGADTRTDTASTRDAGDTARRTAGPAQDATSLPAAARGTDLFAAPTVAERNRAATEAKDAQRNGLSGGRADTGDGGLFDGKRPEQTRLPDAPAIGQPAHGISQSGNPRQLADGDRRTPIRGKEPNADASRNLRRFMAGSKAVDATGKPLTVYHGTNEDFWTFDGARSGAATAHSTSPLGHFFTERRGQAEHYARNAADGVPAEERVIDAHLAIKSPAEWTMERLQRIDTPEEARRVRRNLEKSGFDGIHIPEAGQWIAFKPEQIKSASANRGTFDAANPDMRFSTKADDSVRGRLPGDHVGRGKLDVGEVNRIASRILSVDAERAGVHVVPDFNALPPELQQRAAKQSAQAGDINAVHWKGESWILASEMRDAAHVAEMIFHEHYTHGGLRAQYDKELGPKLDSLLEGVGGVDGVQRMAREQGIDLSEYEKASAANPRMSEQNKRRVLIEELLAHMSKATGTLKRVLQEWWGMLREWLRRHGLAELAKYNATDMARVLREARQAAQAKMAGDAREPFFQRAWHGSPHRDIEETGFKLEKIGTGEGNQAYGHGIYFGGKRETGDGRELLASAVERPGRGCRHRGYAIRLGGEERSATAVGSTRRKHRDRHEERSAVY